MRYQSTILFLLMVVTMGCSRQIESGVGVRKTSADGWFQIFYLTEEVALYKHTREEGLRSLPLLVKASPFKPTLFQEDYSTGDTIGKTLLNGVWKVAIANADIIYGICIQRETQVLERVYFVIQNSEPLIFQEETEWLAYLGEKGVSPVDVKLTSEIVSSNSIGGKGMLPAWSEPVLDELKGSSVRGGSG